MIRKGLASADEVTRRRVAEAGGNAFHLTRGLETADNETRERVARSGGRSSKRKRI